MWRKKEVKTVKWTLYLTCYTLSSPCTCQKKKQSTERHSCKTTTRLKLSFIFWSTWRRKKFARDWCNVILYHWGFSIDSKHHNRWPPNGCRNVVYHMNELISQNVILFFTFFRKDMNQINTSISNIMYNTFRSEHLTRSHITVMLNNNNN